MDETHVSPNSNCTHQHLFKDLNQVAIFSVAARTLVHLGAELITSDEVAINELIKNAFDAESPRVKVDIHIPVPHSVIDESINKISKSIDTPTFQTAVADIRKKITNQITDTNETQRVLELLGKIDCNPTKENATKVIESINYISIEDTGCGMDANTLESVFLAIGTPSKLATNNSKDLSRKILGNKGIGRLAMMRLGDNANVTSWTKGGQAHEINFDWRLFDDPTKDINDISLEIKPSTRPRQTESGTVITISALKSHWTDEKVRNKLIGDFLRRLQNPFVKPEEKREASAKNLQTLTNEKKKPSGFPIDVHVNGGARIPIEGMKKLLTDLVQTDMELEFDPSELDESNGSVLRTELIDYQRGNEPEVTIRTTAELTHALSTTAVALKKIGPIRATIRWFNRDRLRQQATLHGNWKAAKAELDIWSGGIAIYRDGFRVGFSGQSTGEDWLGLDSSALKRGGFAVNRIQTVGALEISRAENPGLVDRSNREGLIESSEANLVREMLTKFAIDELRRYIEHEGQEDKKARLDNIVESAPATIRARVLQAEQGLTDIRSKVSPEVQGSVQSIADHLHFIKNEVTRFEEASKLAGERREDILELAGVGTVMSGVLHELTRTTGHTRQLMQKLSKDESPQTKALLGKLDAEIKAINTRLRQLDPLTPSGRHRKEIFDLSALLNTIIEGYAARFERHEVNCKLIISNEPELRPVKVNMVRGFVSLAIENLITNSIYWVQQGAKAGRTERCITIELDPESRTLTLRDNGPGISPADKNRIFTAGFSLRPRGQGLGLFIAAEVATYHEAKLVLDSADDDGRFRGFVLELPKE
ncbi:sensor histidine kinase [Pseudomonas sp. A014]|uniref:sensor histidine kinase n=1 Tax=Pseudomonas sp. A014 TaxID=3458058 RepID=UPI004035DE5B